MEDDLKPESIESLTFRLEAEAKVAERERNIKMIPSLQTELEDCLKQLREFETKLNDLEQRLKSKKLKEKQEKLWYFFPLAVVIAFTVYIVSHGWVEKPSVSITYNVGEIIGGSLVGIGTLIAGAAYAFRRFRGE
jgi:hypothetical protein